MARNDIRRSTYREVRDCYPQGSAPPVVVHGERQLQRNRNPSFGYKIIRDPRLALKCARRDNTFYDVVNEAYGSLAAARIDTVQTLDVDVQPASYRFLQKWRDRIARNNEWMKDIEVTAQYVMLNQLLDIGVTDMVRCFEGMLDYDYLSYHTYVERRTEELEHLFECPPQHAITETFIELASLAYSTGHLIDERLDNSCVAPRQLDIAASYLN